MMGARTWLLAGYEWTVRIYENGIPHEGPKDIPPEARRRSSSAAFYLRELGIMIHYADKESHTGRRKRMPIDVNALVARWKDVVVGMATAHDKDDADRYEAAIDDCLTPILTAPIAQVRLFAQMLAKELEEDKRVPLLVHTAFRVWVDQMKKLPDEDVKQLKTDLAREIVEMVEGDAKRDLPTAMVRALQWRSPEQLEKVKAVVAAEKEAGRPVRLRGRESCLFLEAGGSEENPEVCIQV